MNEEVLVITEEGKKPYKLKDVKNLVVRLSGNYYFKTSPMVTRVEGEDGKWRYYRKNSPLVTPDEELPGAFLLKANCYCTEDGVYLKKTSKHVVKLNGKYYRKSFVVKLKDEWYLKSDEKLVEYQTGHFILKEDTVLLSPKFYGSEQYWPKDNVFTTTQGDIIKNTAIYSILDGETGELFHYHNNSPEAQESQMTVIHDFTDKLNPQEKRLVSHNAFTKDKKYFVEYTILPGYLDLKILIHKSKLSYFDRQVNDFILPRKQQKLEQLRIAVNNKFSDWDIFENRAPIFKIVKEPYPGHYNIYTALKFGNKIVSKKCKFTGGLDYSFGVEIETTQGLLSTCEIERLELSAVGDRSIGAGEYITSPLQGDAGILHLKETLASISKECLVDDRCGLHVHVGRMEKHKFNKTSFINLTRLGVFLEEELYQTLPKSRYPTLYHCHSIKRWEKINKNNYASYMGAYIFGRKEWWLAPQEVGNEHVEPYFDFDSYKLGQEYNRKRGIKDWQSGRYKWLNLIHAFHESGHGTVEFRIFPGTTKFEKAYHYILFSLAFVYVAENRPQLIKCGVTLDDISNAAYSKYPAVRDSLNKFHAERKEKFNRTEIYTPDKYHQGEGFESLNLLK